MFSIFFELLIIKYVYSNAMFLSQSTLFLIINLVLCTASPQKHGYCRLMGFLCMTSSVTMTTMFNGEVPAQRSLQHGENSNDA